MRRDWTIPLRAMQEVERLIDEADHERNWWKRHKLRSRAWSLIYVVERWARG